MVYRFSAASQALLTKLNPKLVRVLHRALSYGIMDFKVISTLRTPAEQREKVVQLRSKTQNSKHLPGKDGLARAVDLAPYPVNWADHKPFHVLAGIIMAAAAEEGVNLRAGVWWKSPIDPGHFELVE